MEMNRHALWKRYRAKIFRLITTLPEKPGRAIGCGRL
jgi:hypothetical protein